MWTFQTKISYDLLTLYPRTQLLGYSAASTWTRFGKHLENANAYIRHGSDYKRSRAAAEIAKQGTELGSIVIIPLQKIPISTRDIPKDATAKERYDFQQIHKQIAEPYEASWMSRMYKWFQNVVNFEIFIDLDDHTQMQKPLRVFDEDYGAFPSNHWLQEIVEHRDLSIKGPG